MLPHLHLIGGPTASGKTAAALELARKHPSLIINADSMQVYKSLPLLTAQPTAAEKAEIPHELFEIFDPSERCSAGKWLELAEKAIVKAITKGLTPILVGGTGLYFKALEEGLASIPPIPEEIRADSIALYDKLGHDSFRATLAQIDPQSAQKITPNDRQRLIRAYEVIIHTRKTLGEWQERGRENENSFTKRFTLHHHIIMPDREELYARCDKRFLQMVEKGALNEAQNIMRKNLAPDLPAMKILGLRELTAHLRHEVSLDEAIASAQQATRNYAKRQMTWFRNQWEKNENLSIFRL